MFCLRGDYTDYVGDYADAHSLAIKKLKLYLYNMLVIDEKMLEGTNMTPAQLMQEVAIYLYAKGKLSMGQARRIAGMDILQFQELLYNNDVNINYTVNELEEDYKTIKANKL